jgi:uncharacterized protein (TIGR00369 family)
MDFDVLRAGMEQGIPFNGHLGLKITEIGDGRGVVQMPDDEHLRNHVGSQHAGALFTCAEAASGAAFVGAFAERLGEVTPLAKSASIDYLKIAKGPITATGTLGEGKQELLDRLDADGRVQFAVTVSLADEAGTEVAKVTVDWHVRKNA